MSGVEGSTPSRPLRTNWPTLGLASSTPGSFSMKKRTPRCQRNASAENAAAQVRTRRR